MTVMTHQIRLSISSRRQGSDSLPKSHWIPANEMFYTEAPCWIRPGRPYPYPENEFRWVEAVTAFVVVRRGEKITEQEIIDRCKKELAPFKVPKKIVLMDALPKTPTGKILKRDMRASNKELFTQNK